MASVSLLAFKSIDSLALIEAVAYFLFLSKRKNFAINFTLNMQGQGLTASVKKILTVIDVFEEF